MQNNRQLTFQKRWSNNRLQSWQHCMCVRSRPLVAIVPCMKAVFNNHIRGASRHRSHVKMRSRKMPPTAPRPTRHTEHNAHIDDGNKQWTNPVQNNNNLLCGSGVGPAASNRGITVFVRVAGHCSIVPFIHAVFFTNRSASSHNSIDLCHIQEQHTWCVNIAQPHRVVTCHVIP